MIRTLLLFMFITTMSLTAWSQATSNCQCCNENYRQFDFWIGEWVVYDTTGIVVGINKILLMQDSCLLQENWQGARGSTGTSYNYYNKNDSSWNQLWIDNSGTVLNLKGNLKDGKMILQDDQPGEESINRIVWEPLSDGSVIQTWDITYRSGLIKQRLFKGIYRRK